MTTPRTAKNIIRGCTLLAPTLSKATSQQLDAVMSCSTATDTDYLYVDRRVLPRRTAQHDSSADLR